MSVVRNRCIGVVLSVLLGVSLQSFVLADELNSEQQKQVDELTQQIKANPNDYELWAERAVVYRRAHDHEKAEPDIEEALKLNPKWQQGFMFKAIYLDERKRPREAIEAINCAEKIGPLEARDYALRGAIYGLLKDYKPALKDLNQAIAMDPTKPKQFGSRAFVKLQLYGPNEEVVQDLEQSLKLNPANEFDRALLKDVCSKMQGHKVDK